MPLTVTPSGTCTRRTVVAPCWMGKGLAVASRNMAGNPLAVVSESPPVAYSTSPGSASQVPLSPLICASVQGSVFLLTASSSKLSPLAGVTRDVNGSSPVCCGTIRLTPTYNSVGLTSRLSFLSMGSPICVRRLKLRNESPNCTNSVTNTPLMPSRPGMTSSCPAESRLGLLMLLAFIRSSRSTLKSEEINESVSPDCTI